MSELTPVPGTATGDIVLRALDAAALRHLAHAANVANVSTEGWRTLRVSFEDQLIAARSALLDRDDDVVRRALATVQPSVEASSSAQQVRLDQEVALMLRNALHYQALLTGLSKSAAILRLAVREGRS